MFVIKKIFILAFFIINISYTQDIKDYISNNNNIDYKILNATIDLIELNNKKRDSKLILSKEYKENDKHYIKRHIKYNDYIYFSEKSFTKKNYELFRRKKITNKLLIKKLGEEYNSIFSKEEIKNYLLQLNVKDKNSFHNKKEYYKQFDEFQLWNKNKIKNKKIKFSADKKTNFHGTEYYLLKPIYSINKIYAISILIKGESQIFLIYKKESDEWKPIWYQLI